MPEFEIPSSTHQVEHFSSNILKRFKERFRIRKPTSRCVTLNSTGQQIAETIFSSYSIKRCKKVEAVTYFDLDGYILQTTEILEEMHGK